MPQTGKTFIIEGRIDQRPIEWADSQAGLNNLLNLMTDEDRARFMGDLLRQSARDRWTYHIGALETYDPSRLVSFWYGESQKLDELRFIFPVSLEGQRSNLSGLLVVTFDVQKGRIPVYRECSINT